MSDAFYSRVDVGPGYRAPADCAREAPAAYRSTLQRVSWQSLVDDDYEGGESSSGERVSKRTALTCAALYRGVQRIAGDVAKLPIHLYRVRDGGGRERSKDHPSYSLLRRRPNPQVTALTFKEKLLCDEIMHGNGYAWIERDGAARAIALWNLDPHSTWPVRYNGVLWYAFEKDGKVGKLPAEDVLHVRAIGDELSGWSVLTLAAESLGVSLAARRYGAKFFKNGARASGVLMTPNAMPKEAAKNLLRDFDKKQAGTENTGRTILLEEGAKYVSNTITQDEAQFLETRQFENREAAVWLGCPPHFVGDTTSASYSSLEEQNQSYLDGCLDLHLARLETECDRKLLTEEEQRQESHYFEVNRDALLKTNREARSRSYAAGRQWGWLNVNEIRVRENLDPIGPQGDIYLAPVNMQPADQAIEDPSANPADPPKDNGRPKGSTQNSKRARPKRKLPPPPAPSPVSQPPVSAETKPQRAAIRSVLHDVATRMAKRLAIHGRKTLAKAPSRMAWQRSLAGEHRQVLLDAFTPAAGLVPDQDGWGQEKIAREMADWLLLTASAQPDRADFETTAPADLCDIFCPLEDSKV